MNQLRHQAIDMAQEYVFYFVNAMSRTKGAGVVGHNGTPARHLLMRRTCVVLLAPLLLAGAACARSSYMGISLTPGHASLDLQELARRAQAGDKRAQLELGIRFERGRGVPQDKRRAIKLYKQAASDSGGTMWVYVPSPGNGAPSRVIPVYIGPKQAGLGAAASRLRTQNGGPSVPIIALNRESETSAPSASGGKNVVQFGHIIADRWSHTDLEIAQIADLLISILEDREVGDLSAEGLLKRLAGDQTPPAATPDPPFPSQIIVFTRHCGSPTSDFDRFVAKRMCSERTDRYDEVVFQDFARWRGVTDILCRECLARYNTRQEAFTIDAITPHLKAIGYSGVGVIQDRTWHQGFPSPLVHSAFERGDGPPIVIGHRPHPTTLYDAGRPPAIAEIRVFFPVREQQ